jgi:glycolate oxidase
MEEAGAVVSDVIGGGIIPAAIEMMDSITIEAAEAAVQAGYPPGCGAVLIVEFDGPRAQVEDDLERVLEICSLRGARETRTAKSAEDRARIWRGRKAAFAAMGRVSPNYYVQDGVVPRTRLPQVLHSINELSERAGLRVGNVFHAGDGNLHPLVLYDARIAGQAERAEALANEILVACVDAGGSITGEHGVGADKACAMPLMFSEQDLEAMARLRSAFDPDGLANPGKVFPTPRLCGEVPGPYRVHAIEQAGLGERL